LKDQEIAPPQDLIFSALSMDVADVKCVIVGQDPYPTRGNAHGLAFSVPKSVSKIPASLKNIFIELESDLGIGIPTNGDLSPWVSQGVLLLNRVLTTRVGRSDAHKDLGWQVITETIAEQAAKQSAVAILWGKQAQELRDIFSLKVESVHPSPLSAYRGFFGSKPFSQVNAMLKSTHRAEIDWSLA
jgi:uracil-DNA glycosylase